MSEKSRKRRRVDWHKGTVSAIRLELLDFEDILEYKTEYLLASPGPGTRHAQRIDLLVIFLRTASPSSLPRHPLPRSIAAHFRQFNVFEIKGPGDTLGTDSYHKAISYVSQLIVLSGETDQYTRRDVTLTLVSFRYPRKLMSHLRGLKDHDGTPKISIENVSAGVYHICKETYDTYLIVLKELPPEDYQYMRCLCDGAKDPGLLDSVSRSCHAHPDHEVYDTYFSELLYSVKDKLHPQKEDTPMCEAIFEIFGTSSQEIAEKAATQAREDTRKEDQNIIDDLAKANESLAGENSSLANQNSSLADENLFLRALLAEKGIAIPAR